MDTDSSFGSILLIVFSALKYFAFEGRLGYYVVSK